MSVQGMKVTAAARECIRHGLTSLLVVRRKRDTRASRQ